MGIFSRKPTTTADHLTRFEQRVEHPTSSAQKAGIAAYGAIDAASTAALAGGGAIIYDTVKKNPDLAQFYKSQSGIVSREGKFFSASASLLDVEKLNGLMGKIGENLRPRNLVDSLKSFGRSNPKVAMALGAGATALTALDVGVMHHAVKQDNDTEIAESVRALRKSYSQAGAEERSRIAAGLSGGSWVEKVSPDLGKAESRSL